MDMARPSSLVISYDEADTFPRSTRMRIRDCSLSLRSGLEWCIHQAFPEQGCLAGTFLQKECTHIADLPGRVLLSLASAALSRTCYSPPDLPSNCSSLRDLNCTHSNYKTQKSPVSVFIVTTSPCRDWVICAPAAFLGCGSRFSGSLSGIEP
jgi:hypothetical protein